MSNHAWIAAGVIAMFIGCDVVEYPVPPRAAPGSPPAGDGDLAAAAEDGSSGAEIGAARPVGNAEQGTVPSPCPDPPNCTAGNGTGIYAAEGGFAGITARVVEDGSRALRAIMITQFIVQTPAGPDDVAVTFTYGYFKPKSNAWTPLSSPGVVGRVESADYREQKGLQVIGALEISTAPIWVLRNPASNTTVSVTDKQLVDLTLHVSFTVPGGRTILATLGFNAASATPRVDNFKTSVRVYDMRWQNLSDSPGVAPQPYCHGPNNSPDTAVFQQGIAVDPENGAVTRPTATGIVTLSCSLGAPAVVYRWGYPYHGSPSDTFYFDAGIQMKRASYCGDTHYYTVAGTRIQITDDRSIQSESIRYLEAQWAPSGAICVDYHSPDYLRHPEMGFTGQCGTRLVNPCTGPALLPYLADGPVTLPSSP